MVVVEVFLVLSSAFFVVVVVGFAVVCAVVLTLAADALVVVELAAAPELEATALDPVALAPELAGVATLAPDVADAVPEEAVELAVPDEAVFQ